jgi:hypothetical protein
MPAQQGLGPDEEPPPASATEESAQSGEQRPVTWSQRRAGHLVAEHHDVDRQFFAVTPEEPE